MQIFCVTIFTFAFEEAPFFFRLSQVYEYLWLEVNLSSQCGVYSSLYPYNLELQLKSHAGKKKSQVLLRHLVTWQRNIQMQDELNRNVRSIFSSCLGRQLTKSIPFTREG